MRIQTFLKTSPVFAIYTAYDRVVRRFQERLAEEDLHLIQALIVTGIFFEGRPVRPSELAETLGCTRSNISHAIRSLEKAGLIERELHRGDARAYLLTLTRAGRRKAPRLIKIFDSTQTELESSGGKELNSELARFLNRDDGLSVREDRS
jgi:DNA-binding MarR family transcriptional regulator